MLSQDLLHSLSDAWFYFTDFFVCVFFSFFFFFLIIYAESGPEYNLGIEAPPLLTPRIEHSAAKGTPLPAHRDYL